MPWFRVDDGLHSHPKVIKLSLAAIGLWTLAGSWSMDNLTDGFIPATALDHIRPRSRKYADELVTAGMWRTRTRRGEDGWQFHDWLQKNPSKKSVLAERKSNADRQNRWREAHSSRPRNAVTNAVTNSAPALTQPSIAEVVASTTDRPPRNVAKTDFRSVNGSGAATPQPPPVAEAVRRALNPPQR